jgi:citrate synthase
MGNLRLKTPADLRPSIPGIPDQVARRGDYLSRAEVLDLLGIKQQTLYAYVSRGFIRSVTHPDGRSSFYVREDVEKVRSRAATRSGRGPIAASAMRWGEPVIDTAITEITDGGPSYRSRSAVDLARGRLRFENVAEFLWSGDLLEDPICWKNRHTPRSFSDLLNSGAELHPEAHLVQLMGMAVMAHGIAAGTRRERIRAGHSPIAMARDLMRTQAGIFGFLGPRRCYASLLDGEPIGAGLARLLDLPDDGRKLDAINGALVIVADHELNPATFAARVAASGSSDLHSCIGAALNTHYGTLVGRACDRVEALFLAPADPASVLNRARQMLDAARCLPGFDHPLYPHGDPRARYLVASAVEVGSSRPIVRNMLLLLSCLEEEYGVRPGVECGLVLLCRALGLPDRTAAGLYALGRSAGWVAHILEQRLAGFVIRPRAKYCAGIL